MKTPPFLWLLALVICLSGCAKPAKPHQMYANQPRPVGGAMRLAQSSTTKRNPPPLPTLKQQESPLLTAANGNPALLDNVGVQSPPPPSAADQSVSATPKVISTVPEGADAYYQGPSNDTPVLSSLFNSIFQTPEPPTTSSSATYKVVK